MRLAGLALCATVLATMTSASFADTITGKVVAYDRKAGVVVLDDRSIYSLAKYDAPVLDDLKAGDRIKIETSGEGEDGYGLVTEVTIQN